MAQPLYGPTKTFTVKLSSLSNSMLSGSSAAGTILNSNPPPSASISDPQLSAPITGTATATFTVTLSAASEVTSTVDYATVDGTAKAGADYTVASGSLSIPAGSTSGQIPVTILAATGNAGVKTFTVNIAAPVNVIIGTASAPGTIDSGPQPTSLAPSALGQGATKAVVVSGANFAPTSAAQLAAPGVTFTSVTAVNSTTIDATAKVAKSATTGPVAVSVTQGSSIGTCTCLTIDPAPTVAAAQPIGVAAGGSGAVTLTGTGFISGATVSITGASKGVKASNVNVVSTTQLTVKVTVPSTASPGSYTLRVTNADGGSGTCSTCFSVEPAGTVTGINPNIAAQGATIAVTITGTRFAPGASVKGPTGVTFTGITVVSSTQINATMKVAATAPPGSDLPVTVTDSASGFYAKATADILTIT